ncbi:MAG: aminotransferase class I/II-fold pyridoxal phosphate-dependent enzyme [Deltaproteobacteria bacterium]|jgi:8-amino-7-oxononanoate synthase|nr:aminotransferase class I/II-fold pyridoxal phosphate-dependent enzyme [Deltaproteobacteria bacterium]
MKLLDKLNTIAKTREGLLPAGVDPFNIVFENIYSPTEALLDGHSVLLAGTNNYLGLTFDEQCIAAAKESLDQQGTGTTGSRMANGTFAGHRQLENELATFYNCDNAIVFSTGFVANLGIISTLAGPDDVIILDADSHASIYDACKMSGAEMIRFRHNNMTDLEKKLQRLGSRTDRTLIIVEGIYSMLGDCAPMAEIAALKRQYGAWLLVDEAHSMGVMGETGRGMAEAADVESDVDFTVGTFSKSLGAIGGFCVSNRPELDLVRYVCRSYVFTASPSPSTIASVRQALQVIQAKPELRCKLWENASLLYQGLKQQGYELGPTLSPVVAVRMPTREMTLFAWKELLDRGIYVNLVFPPAAPAGMSLLRCSVSAAHTTEQINRILEAFSDIQGLGADNAQVCGERP